MKTIKIYKVTNTEAYMMSEIGSGYSLYPYGKQTRYYKGYDDGGVDYIIPDGYTVEEGNDERLHFYDDKGNFCELVSRFSKPAIVTDDGFLLLKRAY